MRKLFTVLVVVITVATARADGKTVDASKDAARADRKTVDAPKDAVWKAAIAEVGLDYTLASTDKEDGLIVTQDAEIPLGNWNRNKAIKKWIKPTGHNILRGYNGLRVSVHIQISPIDASGTTLEIRAHYEALDAALGKSGGDWVAVESNGTLEHQLCEKISKRVANH